MMMTTTTVATTITEGVFYRPSTDCAAPGPPCGRHRASRGWPRWRRSHSGDDDEGEREREFETGEGDEGMREWREGGGYNVVVAVADRWI